MAFLLRVEGNDAVPLVRTTMKKTGRTEAVAEEWLWRHPEALGDDLMIVATQFQDWASETGASSERLDILALSSSGQPVIVELKRGQDRSVHLQALTYGALASRFTKQTLAAAHCKWWNKSHPGQTMDEVAALQSLTDHVEDEWLDEVFAVPRLLVLAEAFPDAVLTTCAWLSEVAPDIQLECHEYQLFLNDSETLVNFQRIFPVEDLESRRLGPVARSASAIAQGIATRTRGAKSVALIVDNNAIPDGASIAFNLAGLVRPDVATRVVGWLDEDPQRRDVRWVNDPKKRKPLIWGGGSDPSAAWTPTALRDEIFAQAGEQTPAFSALDAWSRDGMSLYQLSNEFR